MKTLFIEAFKKETLNKEKLKEFSSKLPETIYIAYSIQFKKIAEQIKNEIESRKNKKILGFSQILGCSKIKTNARAILLVGQARFHALNLAANSDKEVYVFDNHSLTKIGKEEIDAMRKAEKGRYLKFLSSNKVGIIISTKPGQNKTKEALNLKRELEKKGKNVFLFICDSINIQELENFPDIEIWVNTACPGLSLDSKKIINYRII